MNILFVNNGSFYSGLLTEFLCFNGYTVYEASSADRAHEILRHKRVDVILCYVPLDVTESFALLTEVRQHDRSLPIVALMTHSQSRQEQQICTLTPYCLIMPFKAEMLLNMIVEATGIKKTTISFRDSSGSMRASTAAGVS